MASSRDPGAYRYLHLGLNEFRLLEIHPSEPSSPISCSLTHRRLDKNPQDYYIALSYVWGAARNTICICVDGLPIQITLSLYDALHAHRHHEDKVVVWADALCINQRNLQERSNQVMLMGTIYTIAAVVHI